MKKFISIILSLIGLQFCQSDLIYAQQDAVYSQYMFNKLLINPGYTGHPEAISSTVAFRRQWVGLDGSPTSFSANAHMPFKGDELNLGLILSNDMIGITQQTGVFATYAYRLNLDIGKLGIGMNAGFNVHRRKWEDINPIDANDAVFLQETRSLFLPNAGIGVYLENDLYYAGISIPRLLNNKIDYTKNNVSTSKLLRHYYLTGGVKYEINRDIEFQPSMLLRYVSGAPVELDLTAGALFHKTVWIGTTFRSGDAFALLVNYTIAKQITIGYSADFTYTGLSKYSEGTHEILLSYNYARAKTFRSKY